MTTQHVPGWFAVIPSGSAKSFAPIAIASVEAFGGPTVLKEQRIAAVEIISSELFGAATLNPGTVQVTSAGGISSEEHVGFPVVYAAGGAVSFIIVSGMDSLETFGNTTVNVGPVNIAPAGIASAEAFGTQAIAAGATEIRPISIDDAEEFGATVVTPGPVNVASSGIASAEAFGAATITAKATVAATGIASAEAVGAATVTARSTITATGIASAEAFGTAAITRGAVVVLPSGIASAQAFGTATVTAAPTAVTYDNSVKGTVQSNNAGSGGNVVVTHSHTVNNAGSYAVVVVQWATGVGSMQAPSLNGGPQPIVTFGGVTLTYRGDTNNNGDAGGHAVYTGNVSSAGTGAKTVSVTLPQTGTQAGKAYYGQISSYIYVGVGSVGTFNKNMTTMSIAVPTAAGVGRKVFGVISTYSPFSGFSAFSLTTRQTGDGDLWIAGDKDPASSSETVTATQSNFNSSASGFQLIP